MNNKLFENYFKDLHLDFMSEDEKKDYYEKLEKIYMKFFTLELVESMTDAQIETFNELSTEEDQFEFFEKNNIDYQTIFLVVVEQLNKVVKEQMDYYKGYIDGINS